MVDGAGAGPPRSVACASTWAAHPRPTTTLRKRNACMLSDSLLQRAWMPGPQRPPGPITSSSCKLLHHDESVPAGVEQHAGIEAARAPPHVAEAEAHQEVAREHERREVQHAEERRLDQPRVARIEHALERGL